MEGVGQKEKENVQLGEEGDEEIFEERNSDDVETVVGEKSPQG